LGFLKDLLDSYNEAEKQKLVDLNEENSTRILPIYHNSMSSDGKNIVEVKLNQDSKVMNARYLPKRDEDISIADSTIVFPVTLDSGTRTSGKSPHPLVDNFSYLTPYDEEKHELYLEGFRDFYDFVNDEEVKSFLKVILEAVEDANFFNNVVKKLYSEYELKGLKVKYKDDKDKESTDDLSKVFITFAVVNQDETKEKSVTKFTKLHDVFIEYIRANQRNKDFCNISGNFEEITEKHRGLLGNAKIISVGAKETYFGRFQTGSDVIKVGLETSEKAHLMLKFFLENKNSSVWIADGQYLINWFSDDIENKTKIDVTNSKKFVEEESYLDALSALINAAQKEIENESKSGPQKSILPSEENRDVGLSFIKGKRQFGENSDYYVMILDKASNGRISIKYYKKLKTSSLLDNLNNWENKYKWFKYDKDSKRYIDYVPSLGQILLAAYGIERDKKLIIDNKGFRKDQLKKLIISVVEGKEIPKNISKMLEQNIRNRVKYQDTWMTVSYTALCVLSDGRKEDFNMRPIEKQNVDYLYGRLLAIYERTEAAVFDNREEKNEKQSGEGIRVTNAEKFWNSFTNKPGKMAEVLENKTKVYEMKLKVSKPGLYVIFNQEKREIINKIGEFDNIDKPLGYEFIFGYYAELKQLFAKKEDKNE
jgi:CRISPR-associated protein Csd1